MFVSIAYRTQSFIPAFGNPTARANFCEEDFVIVSFIAEFVNTCSNAAYIIYAIWALRRMPADATIAAKSMFHGLLLVGVCSSLFHGLLSYHAQMADDTSMILATAIVLYRAMTFQKSHSFKCWFGGLLLLSVVGETAYHSINDEQVVHELCFVLLIILVAIQTRALVKIRVPNSRDKQKLHGATFFGAGCFVFGYLLWQLDFILCAELRALRRVVGIPWGFLLELHGWWHILTAVGAHTFMIMVDRLTREKVELPSVTVWPSGSNGVLAQGKHD